MLDANVVTDIAAAFGLGAVVGSPSYVDRGVSGEVFKVTTVAGQWAAKRLFKEPDFANLEVQVPLQDAARAAGIASPRQMRTAAGAIAATGGGAHWLVSEWTETKRDSPTLVAEAYLAEVGGIAAALHGLRLEPPHGVVRWLSTPPSSAQWAELHTLVDQSDATWTTAFKEMYPELTRLAKFAGAVVLDAPVLSHCDLAPANFGAADDHLVVFDWDRAGAIPPAQELGYVLLQWAKLGEPETIVPTIVASYRSRNGRVAVGPDIFACAANGFLNFLSASIRAANDRRVAQLLEDPMTLDSLKTLADFVSGC